MNEEILSFYKKIEQGTGLKLKVYFDDGTPCFSEDEESLDIKAQEVYTDQAKDITVFSFKLNGVLYFGALSGVGEENKIYASLIVQLAEKEEKQGFGLSRSDFLRAVLFGEVNFTQIDRYMKKFGLKDSSAFVMVLSGEKEQIASIKNSLNNYCSSSGDFVQEIDDKNLAFVKFAEDGADEYQSPSEYAEFLRQSLYEETGGEIHVSIGSTVKKLVDVGVSFTQALATSRMSDTFSSRGEVHAFKEYVLIKIIEDLPKHKIKEYLEILKDSGAKEIFSDEEMLLTAEEFMENGLNVSETARKMFLHRNTLIYRLDKIENATGLNIRKFADAVTFRLIIILSKLSR